MRNAAGELADGLHLLSRLQCLLGLPAFRDFGSDALLQVLVEPLERRRVFMPVDRDPEQVDCRLQKIDVMLGKGTADLTVGFDNAERFAVGAQNDVDGTLNPVAPQKPGNAKTSVARKIICDNRLAGMQRVAGRRA